MKLIYTVLIILGLIHVFLGAVRITNYILFGEFDYWLIFNLVIFYSIIIYVRWRTMTEIKTVWYWGIKDSCCLDENIIEFENADNIAQCKTCKRIFEVRFK